MGLDDGHGNVPLETKRRRGCGVRIGRFRHSHATARRLLVDDGRPDAQGTPASSGSVRLDLFLFADAQRLAIA